MYFTAGPFCFILDKYNLKSMINKYSKKKIQKILQSPSPRILLNVCTHGSEQVGLRVAEYFSKMKPLCGTFVINIANEKAVALKKRFITHDLNRVFPGKKNGSYEEKLAYSMKPFIDAFDVVVDVHSTETGMSSSLIVTDFFPAMKPLLRVISLKRVIYMNTGKFDALISSAKLGIAFECGKDKSKKTYLETVQGVKCLLGYYGMIKLPKRKQSKKKIEFYEVDAFVLKPEGFNVMPGIKNFSLLKKGSALGYNPDTKEKIFAQKSFYTILFGKNSYKTIFGFSSKKRKAI